MVFGLVLSWALFWLCAEMNPSRQEKSSQNQVKIAMKLEEKRTLGN